MTTDPVTWALAKRIRPPTIELVPRLVVMKGSRKTTRSNLQATAGFSHIFAAQPQAFRDETRRRMEIKNWQQSLLS